MRLTCPNCDARYEVPDEVVPATGRDVQCSNCGQTWFQHHPDHAPPEEDAPDAALQPHPPAEDEELAPPPPPAPPKRTEPERRQLDPNVADILRQEAEAEFEARKRRQSQPLESQPDLGLEGGEEPPRTPPRQEAPEDDGARRAQDARRRMARMRGEPEPSGEAAAAAAAMSSRRELLPDIEEINSTLRSDTVPSGVDGDAREDLGAGGEVKKQKRGFRRGFALMLVLFAALLLIYVYAPQIARAVPAVDPMLNSYVTWVDQLRIGLDARIRDLLRWLDEVAASQS